MMAHIAQEYAPIPPRSDTRDAVLSARGLTLAYDPDQPILLDFDLELSRGEVVAIVGGSGVGKSSLLRVLAGLQPPARGSVVMQGTVLRGVHPRVAIAFQDPALLPWLNVERNVAFGLDFKRQPVLSAQERQQRVDQAIAEVGLQQARHLRPAQISGGMAQRAALARCLTRRPSVLLLDEPFGALDEVTRAEMQQLLLKVVDDFETSAVMITHDIDEALLLADRIVLLGGLPGRMHGTWQINVSHPRTDHLKALGELRIEILTQLRDSMRPVRSVMRVSSGLPN